MTSPVTHRRALHQIPELVCDLPKTLAYVRSVLESLPCLLIGRTEGSLCAYFDFGRESTVALRGDMDALPIPENSSAPYASKHPGVMHACGHDGHTAILLEVATRLARVKPPLPRNVLLIFQPAEETEGGAQPLCESGILKTYKVDRLFGLHLWPKEEKGRVFSRPGAFMARANEINVEIQGTSVHISRAEEGVDALTAGAEFLQRLHRFMKEQDGKNGVPCKCGFGKMTSGTVRNAVSGNTRLEGTLRTYSDEDFAQCKEGFAKIAKDIEGEWGCQIGIFLNEGYPAVWNHEGLYEEICKELGDAAPKTLPNPVLAAEDFAFYQREVPGIFFFLGLGDTPELHAKDFDFDDQTVLPVGVEFFMKLIGEKES